ncbi:MAG: fasciclin domain-containing protein [Prevotella sp.]|nr:fasciclin domain-containing protein [Prevotella sp.]
MKNQFLKSVQHAVLGFGVGVTLLTACNPEPDESDLYTFTGQTIESFIAEDSTLTQFNYILSRVGYDKLLASYGIYTCFAPTNEGVASYCDSLYNDEEAIIPHNGMTSPTVEGLSDSLCLNIVKFHLTNQVRDIVSLTGENDVNTLLGYEFSYATDSLGQTVLGGKAIIIDSDNETINGIVHVIDNVIPRFTRFIGDILDRNPQYSIFSEALHRTGLADSLLKYSKGSYEFTFYPRDNYTSTLYPGTGAEVECKVGFTVFAEPNSVLSANRINSFEDLVNFANETYGDAAEWYDYPGKEQGVTISTGNDYTNRFNALNMFVAYHILNASMSVNQLVYEKSTGGGEMNSAYATYWNYAPDADPYDYYETMLPHTMMKIWNPHDQGRQLFINRYQTYNTLTDEVGTQGSAAMHQLVRRGVGITRTTGTSLQAYNGYVHAIDGMLVYDRMVPRGVLNERMRVNCTSLFPELITNRFRYWATGDGNTGSGYDNSRVGIPQKFFDNAVFYNDNIFCFAYCLHGAWRSFESDQMQFWGRYDWAFKLPAVPSGLYEIRVVYAPMSYGSFMQYYIGNSSNVQMMTPLGLPFDATVQVEDPRIGMTDAKAEEDQGIASDIAMHNRSYMRGPHSYTGHGENGWNYDTSARFEYGTGSYTIRYVLGRVQLNQGDENWLRIKTLNPDNPRAPVGLDFVELVPTSVVDNQQYIEDWY